MPNRVLILTTGKGGGHRSSSDAIKSAILELDPLIAVRDVDAMECFPGYGGDEQGYIALTSRYRLIWKLFFEISSAFSGISNAVLAKPIYKKFSRLVSDYRPDVILSVHPCFVGSVSICLKRMRLSIPLHTCVIDLGRPSRLWYDKACAVTYVPTDQIFTLLLKAGFEPGRVVHSGFPIGQRFNSAPRDHAREIGTPNVLMVNPTLKGNDTALKMIMETLARGVNLTVVTGSDVKLRQFLDEKRIDSANLTILDYVRDMEARLSNADVIITKAGPNMILEAVRMGVPVLVTGHILGQEEGNGQYIAEGGYGLCCESPEQLGAALDRLFADDYALLKQLSANEGGCADTAGAMVVANHVVEALGEPVVG